MRFRLFTMPLSLCYNYGTISRRNLGGTSLSNPQVAQYGSWKSPITTDAIVAGPLSPGQVVVDGGDVYGSEGRPAEKGRVAIMRRTPGGEVTEITPPEFYVR